MPIQLKKIVESIKLADQRKRSFARSGPTTSTFSAMAVTHNWFMDTFSSSLTLRACASRYSGRIGDSLGLFLRYGWQDADATVDDEAQCCGGINITGKMSIMCAIFRIAAVPEACWKGLEPEDIV